MQKGGFWIFTMFFLVAGCGSDSAGTGGDSGVDAGSADVRFIPSMDVADTSQTQDQGGDPGTVDVPQSTDGVSPSDPGAPLDLPAPTDTSAWDGAVSDGQANDLWMGDVVDAGGDALDGAQADVVDDEGCVELARQIYVAERDNNRIYRFFPIEGIFELVGEIDCDWWGTPGSMGVTRDGLAYVNWSDGSLYEVDLIDASCSPTDYDPNASGFGKFGMGFATTDGSTTNDTLYVANDETLARFELSNWSITEVGPMTSQAELTGNKLGELWAILPLDDPPRIVKLSTVDGSILQELVVTGLPTQDMDTFAFANWGGSFYVFIRNYGLGNTTNVWKVPPSGVATLHSGDIGFDVVGAGVSTCAPILPGGEN